MSRPRTGFVRDTNGTVIVIPFDGAALDRDLQK